MDLAILGIDGSGKSTLANDLAKALADKGYMCEVINWFKDDKIRSIGLTITKHGKMTPEVLAALYAASTIPLVEKSLASPAKIKIWDQYIYNSYANCLVRGSSHLLMKEIIDIFPKPDLIVFLRSSPEICYERILKRGGTSFFESGLDRLFRDRTWTGYELFKRNEISDELTKSVFCHTMAEWNQSIANLLDAENLMVFEDYDLSEKENVINNIISTIDGLRTLG